MPQVYSSISTLTGVREFNDMDMITRTEDVGGKIAYLISSINILNATVSILQAALVSANASGATLSALSGVTFTPTLAPLANFRA